MVFIYHSWSSLYCIDFIITLHLIFHDFYWLIADIFFINSLIIFHYPKGYYTMKFIFTNGAGPHFMDQWTSLSLCRKVHISDTISNRSAIFGVQNECKVSMSNWQVSSDIDLIYMVKWLKVVFVFWSLFLILYAIGHLYLEYRNIL